jgi:hypothetical protein
MALERPGNRCSNSRHVVGAIRCLMQLRVSCGRMAMGGQSSKCSMMAMSERSNDGWAVLLKFGKRPHLEQFRNHGLLYMNPQNYFSKLDGDLARNDRFEGTDKVFQPNALKHLVIENNVDGTKIVIRPADMAGPLLMSMGKSSCNVYCMFSVTSVTPGFAVDVRNHAFGDSFTIVLNTQEFLDRVCSAAKVANFTCEYRLVEYYDPHTHSGETGPFRKPSTFAYQNEFRLIVRPGSIGPIKLAAGSLLDITTPIYPLSDINELVDFGEESARQAGLA